MNPYPEIPAVNRTRHSTTQGFILVPEDNRATPLYVETHMGPWGWQWKDGVRGLVSVPPSKIRMTIKALMDDIEKDAPGMYRTVTDLEYSRSPECPFIVDEPSMADLRSCLYRYEKEKTLLSTDAQTGVRKSVAAAFVERKGLTPNGTLPIAVYPYSMDVNRIVDGLREPRRPFEYFSAGEPDHGSGAMSMDLGIVYEAPPTASGLPPSSKAVGLKVRGEVGGADRVDGCPGSKL